VAISRSVSWARRRARRRAGGAVLNSQLRLAVRRDGLVVYRVKNAGRGRVKQRVMTPIECLARLALPNRMQDARSHRASRTRALVCDPGAANLAYSLAAFALLLHDRDPMM
jgi:hypothetical protein